APARVLPLRHAEEDDGRHAQVPEPPALLGRAVDRALRDARHRRDRLLHPTSGHDEERLHELGRVDARLAHQVAERLAAAETAWARAGRIASRGTAERSRSRRGGLARLKQGWPRESAIDVGSKLPEIPGQSVPATRPRAHLHARLLAIQIQRGLTLVRRLEAREDETVAHDYQAWREHNERLLRLLIASHEVW